MKKRIFSMLLALVMVFSMIPTSAFAVGTGTAEITNTHEDIPKTGDNTDVTGLAMMGTGGILGFLATAFCLLPRKKGKYQR